MMLIFALLFAVLAAAEAVAAITAGRLELLVLSAIMVLVALACYTTYLKERR